MSGKKRVFQLLFFALVTGITLYVVFSGQDLSALIQGIRRLDPVSLILAVALGVLFVSMEGIMIWHLLRSMNGKSSLRQCICYSFIGFFYSGITPSATGGQPMQLYYMCKDGNKASDSSLVLMTVAAFYKFVLVLIGIVTALLWGRRIREYLGTYEPVFWLGLFLNSALVAMIVCLMVMPRIMEKIAFGVLDLVYRVKNRKKAGRESLPARKPDSGKEKPAEADMGDKKEKVSRFIRSYKESADYLKKNKGILFRILFLTFLQRGMVFFVTALIYKGYGLSGNSAWHIMALQASVYIAVDMLPVPGSQGITEMMYTTVMLPVFGKAYLMPSMIVTRAVNFYILLIISLIIVLGYHFVIDQKKSICYNK
mgnify:CR=1 FL=1